MIKICHHPRTDRGEDGLPRAPGAEDPPAAFI